MVGRIPREDRCEDAMELTHGGRCEALPPHKDGVPARLRGEAYASFWVVLEGGAWGSPLTVHSPDGKEAIALFSGEEEAMMLCRFRAEEGANATIRRTTAGGVLSLMYCPWSPKRVTLDPFPGALGERFLELLTIDRARFARRFAGVGSEPVVRVPRIDQIALPLAASSSAHSG
jgi:hypothetical protein